MARGGGIQTSFNAGELSPLIAGRPDVAKWGSGCERMEGFIPTVQGPAFSRPGFRYVAEVKTSTDRTWLLRFEFSVEQSYQIEFGDLYCRFYTNRAVLESSPGVPYEIVSPYALADLTNSDGSCALRAVQTGDVLYIFHGSYPTRKLVRTAPTSWAFSTADFNPPPFKDINVTATTVYASAATGTGITLTASAALFTSAMVGDYFYLAENDVRNTKLWEAGKAVLAGDVRRSDGKNYSAGANGTTGGTKPTHSRGAAYDGDAGVQWTFLGYTFGWAKITGFTSSTVVTADVIQRIPADAVGAPQASTRWALSAWNATDGYPTVGTFFRERLTAARGSLIAWSVAGDFENFSETVDGQSTADAGFTRTLASDRVNTIRWLSPGNVLLVGTNGPEWAIVEQSATEAFGPSNCQAKPQSAYGSNYVAPVRVGDLTLFFQKAGRKMRAMAFRFEEDGFKSDDTTVFANHVTKSGIIDMAYSQEPQSIVWCVRADGVLAAMTFSREQDVIAWHRHPLQGGIAECVEEIPSPDGSANDVWVIARYTIDGVTKRYVAYLSDFEMHDEDGGSTIAQEDWAYSDMHAVYDGAAATTISGLDYLEGEEVWVLADGAFHPNRTVSGGSITLQLAASKVIVGLPNHGKLQPMQVDGGGGGGTAQGRIKRVHGVTLRLLGSMRGQAGPNEANLTDLQLRDPATPMGTAPPPFTGDTYVEWPGDYEVKTSILIERDSATPVHVVATMPRLVTSDR